MQIWRDLNREAHLWYTITSAEYVVHAKPLLKEALDVLRRGLNKNPLAADYAPVPYWGGVMEDILANFDHALMALKAGNLDPIMRQCARLMDVPRGFSESVQWLEGQDNVRMLGLIDEAYSVCSRLLDALTMSQRFLSPGYQDGSKDWHTCMPDDAGIVSNTILMYYEEPVYNVIGRPTHIPEYAADTRITCKTGEIVPWTGVWMPTTGMGTAALAFARQGVQIMQPAYELAREFAPDEYVEATKLVDTAWHPVKPTGRMVPLPPADSSASATGESADTPAYQGRVEAGQPCPREGWWLTPSKAESRRRFKQGDAMPAFSTDYGTTIWQWDDNQT
jgi:hypothetical protein